MASDVVIKLHADVKFHDPFPREAYIALCLREGRDVTADGYERWRDTCERLSGEMSTERRIAKVGDQLRELGVLAGKATSAFIRLAPNVAYIETIEGDER